MNRNNIWIHVGIAVTLITLAAVLGQIDRWRTALKVSDGVETRRNIEISEVKGSAKADNPEVLVRFKPGVSLGEIRRIAALNHDRLSDEIESVSGLTVIDDLDDAAAQAVADQYAAMSDSVLY